MFYKNVITSISWVALWISEMLWKLLPAKMLLTVLFMMLLCVLLIKEVPIIFAHTPTSGKFLFDHSFINLFAFCNYWLIFISDAVITSKSSHCIACIYFLPHIYPWLHFVCNIFLELAEVLIKCKIELSEAHLAMLRILSSFLSWTIYIFLKDDIITKYNYYVKFRRLVLNHRKKNQNLCCFSKLWFLKPVV